MKKNQHSLKQIAIAILFATTAFWGCDNQAPPPPPIDAPVLVSVSQGAQMVYRKVIMSWSHPTPTAIDSFRIEYSLHHSDWTTFRTLNNQTFSLDETLGGFTDQATSPITTNSNYRWRVVAMKNNVGETPSCSKSTFMGMGLQEMQVRPFFTTLKNKDFTTTLELNLYHPNFITVAGSTLSYHLLSYNGTVWVQVGTEIPLSVSNLPFDFSIPINTLPTGVPHRVQVLRRFNGSPVFSNIIEFYNQPWPVEDLICQ